MDTQTKRSSRASNTTGTSRLSVHLPSDSLFSSIVTSSRHFYPVPEPVAPRQNVNLWISDDEESSNSHRSVPSSLARPTVLQQRRTSMRSVVSPRNSILGVPLRHDEIRPRSVALSESTEKLDPFSLEKGFDADVTSLGPTQNDTVEYPKGVKLGLVTLALCLAVFVMALDNSIIATAIPRITDDFHSLQDVGWYGSAYMLTTAALQLLFGKLYTFWSIKWTFLGAVVIFEIGSLICAVAPSSTVLIVGRAIAGIGSAGIFAGALTILAYSVPLETRPVYTGLISGMWGVASVAGPLLGGVFTDQATWRWCFYINLPIGAVTLAVIGFFFPDPQRNIEPAPWRTRLWQLDPVGTCVFMPAIICVLLALQWGGIEYPWDDSRITSLLMLSFFLVLLFMYIQYKMQDNATVPLRLVKKRSVWASAFFSFNTGACFLTSMYFLPIWFQAVKGASPISSGVRNLPMLLSVVIFGILSGAVVSKWGYYTPLMIFGSVLMAIGYGLITTFDVDIGAGGWIGYQLIAGIGIGMGLQQPLIAVQVVCEMADIPTCTTIVIFMQTLGGALFVSIGQTVFTNKLVSKVIEYVPDLDPQIVVATGVTNIRNSIRPEWVGGVIQAYNDALTTSFIVGAATASATIIGALLVEWKSVKGKNIEAAMG